MDKHSTSKHDTVKVFFFFVFGLQGTGTRIELGQEVGVTVQPLKWRYGPEWS